MSRPALGAALVLAGCLAAGDEKDDSAAAGPLDPAGCQPLDWTQDADGDSWGDGTGAHKTQCTRPGPDWVLTPGDCDDTDGNVHPAATEVCNGTDDNCDARVDDDDPALDLATATTGHADSDGDGFGDPAAPLTACVLPATHVLDDTDCDDTEATVFPGNTETCNDGLDNNCDGLATPCARLGSYDAGDAEAQITAEGGSDTLGTAVAVGLDADGDGQADLLVGADGASPGGLSKAGAAYVLFGPLTGTVPAISGARLDGEATDDQVGDRVAAAGDLDGDGFDDLVVGAENTDFQAAQSGAAYVVHGPLSAGTTASLSTAVRWEGLSTSAYAGDALAGAFDFDNDGNDDVLVGAYGDDAAYLLLGPATGGGLLSTADATWTHGSLTHFGGAVAAAGDLDGDGIDDLAVGASRDSTAASEAGAAFVFLGPLSATPSPAAAPRWTGGAADDGAGFELAGVGDVDGDGLDDLLIGATGLDSGGLDAGGAHLVLGPATAGGSLTGAAATLVGEDAGDAAGLMVAGAGDVDQDGRPDLLVGAPSRDEFGTNAGKAYVVFGPVTGTVDLGTAAVALGGSAAVDWFGWSGAGRADLTGDGEDDLVVGAFNGGTGGTAYLFHGLGL